MEGDELSDYNQLRSIYEYKEMSIFSQLCKFLNVEVPYVVPNKDDIKSKFKTIAYNGKEFKELNL
jgi:hypothetical protein